MHKPGSNAVIIGAQIIECPCIYLHVKSLDPVCYKLTVLVQ